MAIRSSITNKGIPVRVVSRVPWELSYAIAAVNNGYVLGDERTTVDEMLRQAERWETEARQAFDAGHAVYFRLTSQHAARYLQAAELLEQYNGARR